ncbi:HAD-IA family hydrolase [Bacillus sp. JJ1533]|uniref:HAD family hydrolase n=1 Tax=Bacillus sp. JJ1533 TaxID=3122959 RepID=UPI002FFEA48D
MSGKPNLILDIAGVIATNFSPIFWEVLSSKFDATYDDLIKFRKDIREELWTGNIEEQEFWDRLLKKFPTIDVVYAKSSLITTIKPLPTLDQIPIWSNYSKIHLLSNHRIEWVKHIIDPVQDYISSITISGDVGYCKPQVDIFLTVNSNLDNNQDVLFVDDQEKNLIVARNLGWSTLLADVEGEWTNKVTQLLYSY